METGLRYRVRRAARQLAEQHQHIHQILGELDRAIAGESRGRVSEVYALYRSALEAHFSLEDEVFFPALHGLQPEHAAELDALSRDHEGFIQSLGRLGERLSTEPLEGFARAFRDLVGEVGRHESREERVVRELVRAVSGDEAAPDSRAPR